MPYVVDLLVATFEKLCVIGSRRLIPVLPRILSAIHRDRHHDILLVCTGPGLFGRGRCELTIWPRVNYGVLGKIHGTAVYVVPLSLQAVPAM